jgi:type IV pilus assembly protein PilV
MSFFRHQSQSSKGFTLIEVMIALIILAVGLLALMTMQIVSIKANAFSSEMTYSSMLAEQQLENLKYLPFTDPALVATPTPQTLPPIVDNTGASYTVSWQVADTTPTMKTITLTVTWVSPRLGTAAQQAAITTTVETIRSQGDIP